MWSPRPPLSLSLCAQLPELPLPLHLADGVAQEEAQRKQWVRLKASLLRDTRGQFKISLHEDDGGIYLNRIERSDVSDDRDRLASHDYLVSINRKPIEELSLAGVKDVVKHAKSFLELEVRRYAGDSASDYERQQEEERRRREDAQLRRYQEQMNSYVSGTAAKPPPPQQQQPTTTTGFGPTGGSGRDEHGRPTGGGGGGGGYNPRMQGFGPGDAPRRQACSLSSLPSAASSAPNGRGGVGNGHGGPFGAGSGGGGGGGGGGGSGGVGGGGGGAIADLLGLDLLTGPDPPTAAQGGSGVGSIKAQFSTHERHSF